jgi:hypothetical protein
MIFPSNLCDCVDLIRKYALDQSKLNIVSLVHRNTIIYFTHLSYAVSQKYWMKSTAKNLNSQLGIFVSLLPELEFFKACIGLKSLCVHFEFAERIKEKVSGIS